MKTGSVGVWIARVQWSSSNVRWRPERSSNPSYPRFRGIVHQFVGTRFPGRPHLRGLFRRSRHRMDPLGVEPRASSLQRRCSTAELRARLALVVLRCLSGVVSHGRAVQCANGGMGSIVRSGARDPNRSGPPSSGWSRSVGGDPAADSPTATLLRLKPPCEAQIRPL